MKDEQWIELTIAETERKRAALNFLRNTLPQFAPYKAWVSFQFLSLEGATLQVDALVFSESGIFLIELATQRGQLEIEPTTWRQTLHDGKVHAFDNPLRIARLKAEQLASLLAHTLVGSSKKYRLPAIQPLVFLCEENLQPQIAPDAAIGLTFHPVHTQFPSIEDAILKGNTPGLTPPSLPLNLAILERFERAVEQADFESTTKALRFSDYTLTKLIETTPIYQDYLARHRTTDELIRARIFRAPRGAAADQRSNIQEAARREFAIVSELSHPSILQARRHIGHETQPAVIFEQPEGAVRLDHFVRQSQSLSAATRFKLLEQIAEAVRYAHEHRVIHRALSPQSVLVLPSSPNSPSDAPQVRLYNWHTSAQAEHETGTHHVANYLHDTSRLFLAPEIGSVQHIDESADIFGLGALAFFLFTGQAPARDASEYMQTLFKNQGLRITAVRDAVTPALDALIFDATRVRPADRIYSADAFLKRLAQTRDSLVSRREDDFIDPLNAPPGTILADRYQLGRRLGSGATATAFLATRLNLHDDAQSDKTEYVLKIANDDAHASRLEAEARDLEKLNHPLIVEFFESFKVADRTILVLQYAGDTFRDRLRESRALSLDEIRRFGSDLCKICVALENQHVFHRDIKPANLGLGAPTRSGQQLMLFDFSLAGVPIDQIDVGTAAYRDPFLASRYRWDTYADRYSAALVLYEMTTQQLPTWGDGRSNPAFDITANLVLAPERFPAAVRDDLKQFFEKALAREHKTRFGNAVEMANAWDNIFERTLHSDHGTQSLEALLQKAQPTTKLASLGLSQVALDALDALNIITVEDMLARPANDYNFLSGLNNQQRTQLRELRDRLGDIFPLLVYGSGHNGEPSEPMDAALESVDRILDYVLERRPGSRHADLTDLIARMLTSDNPEQPFEWPPAAAMAERVAKTPAEFQQLYEKVTANWLLKPVLRALRNDIIHIVDHAGGAISTTELSLAVLAARGSILTEPQERSQAASIVTRAAVEAELGDKSPRLRIRRHASKTFIATRDDLLHLLPRLGELAGDLAAEDPLVSSERAYEAIAGLMKSAGIEPLPRHRALALAAAASLTAAHNQRDELYPRNMSAQRALTLTANVLLRQAPLTIEKLRQSVQDRYPEAEPLPDRPALDTLLNDAGVALKWNTSLEDGRGAFDSKRHALSELDIAGSTQAHDIYAASTTYPTGTDYDLELSKLEDRLAYKHKNGGFLTVMVHAAYASQALHRLTQSFELSTISIEEIFLRNIQQCAHDLGVEWATLMQADAPNASDFDRDNFSSFLNGYVKPRVQAELLALRGNILLINPGLLVRWHMMPLLDQLREITTRGHGPHLVWLLIVADDQRKRPSIDGAPVPVQDDSEYIRIPSRWFKHSATLAHG